MSWGFSKTLIEVFLKTYFMEQPSESTIQIVQLKSKPSCTLFITNGSWEEVAKLHFWHQELWPHFSHCIRRVHLMSRQTSATVASRASQICNTGAAETRQDAMWACETFAGVTQPRARNYEHPFVWDTKSWAWSCCRISGFLPLVPLFVPCPPT